MTIARFLHHITQFQPDRNGDTRGISSGPPSEDNGEPNVANITGWLFPNLAFLLNGTDGNNAYGGSYETGDPDIFDPDLGVVRPENVIVHPDDDYFIVSLKSPRKNASVEGASVDSETTEWHPLGAPGMREIVHSAGSGELRISPSNSKPSGQATLSLTYAEGNRSYGTFTFQYDLEKRTVTFAE